MSGAAKCPWCGLVQKPQPACKACGKTLQKGQTPAPRCPTCSSDELDRISLGNKVGAALLVGFFAIGHVTKTFRCRNCGHKW